jgi:hypothetical protein
MMRSVRCDHLPASARLPEILQQRIEIDAERHELRFDGFMSKAEYDLLMRLDRDLEYQRAVNELFVICGPTSLAADPAPGKWKLLVTGLAMIAVVLGIAFCVWKFVRPL